MDIMGLKTKNLQKKNELIKNEKKIYRITNSLRIFKCY
jgi:hypothetical protein